MFDQQQHVVYSARPSILDERALQSERIRVGDATEPANV
jgi:hypothetical protein